MDKSYVIEIENVKKYFKLYADKGETAKEKLLFWKRNRYEKKQVLKGISFRIKKGEAVGLIGHNGCGKSTTLKILTRIMYPDSGTVIMNGRVSSLLELGAGFHPDMNGIENIYINASIFGLSKKEIDTRLNDIIEFAELGEYINNPVRTYSSGMYMRLAFAVAINVNADILLIDEVLAVGDLNFQMKCFNKLMELKKEGVTIVLVSHSMEQIELICDRSIWINDGQVQADGKAKEVHLKYLEYMKEERGEMEEEFPEREDNIILEENGESKKTENLVEENNMVFQEIGMNNIISGLDQNSNAVINICGSNNKIDIIDEQYIPNLTIRIIGNNNSIIFKENVKIKEQVFIYIDDNNTYLEVGRNTTFENTNVFMTDTNSKVVIGEDCMFAAGTTILSGDFHSIIDLTTKERINYGYSVIIKNHVWIGLNAKILKNVCIEENSVIAADSLVTSHIPAHSVAGGVPAKVIKSNITWTREKIVEGEKILDRDFLSVSDSDLLAYNLESYEQQVRGWIFLQEQESGNSKLFTEIIYENDLVEKRMISLLPRQDVSDFYGKIEYLFSGFSFFIKEKQSVKRIRLIVENADFIGSRVIYLKN